jgi:hypothetical protein
MENKNENIIETFLSWNEDFEKNISKLRDLEYYNLISFYQDVLTIIYNDIIGLSEEEVCKKYNLQTFEINKIRCVKTNYNPEGKQKGKKWVISDEVKVKNWMMNPKEKTYEELCDELERSGVDIEARMNYLLEKELFINNDTVNDFCQKFNINTFMYYFINNQTFKIEKKYEDKKEVNSNIEEKKEEENYNFLQPKWTNDEEKFLKVIIKNGKNVKEISDLLKRSKDDVEQRIRILIYREFEDQVQNWSKVYKMSTTNILSLCSYQIKKMNDKTPKKTYKKEENDSQINEISEDVENYEEISISNNDKTSLFS